MSTSPPESIWERILSADNLLRLMVVLVFAVYVQTVTFELVYDDFTLITLNPWLHSLSGLKQMFTQHSWAFADGSVPARHYRPMFLVWLWLVQNLAGAAPGWFHLAAIFTHLGATFLAYRVSLDLFEGDKRSSALVALLFALHPSRAEVIGWIAAATESLSAVFIFGSFLAYVKARSGQRPYFLGLVSLLCLAGALLTKESAVLLPVLLVGHEVLIARKREGGVQVRFVGTFVVFMTVVIVGFLFAREAALKGLGDTALPATMASTLFTAPIAMCLLLRQVVWPIGLSALYPNVVVAQFSWKYVGLPVLLLVVVALAYGYWARKSPVLKFAALWLLVFLVPIIAGFNWIQLHDRHIYLPFFGAAIALVFAFKEIRWPTPAAYSAGAVVVAMAIVLAAISAREVRIWRSSIALFTRAVEIAPKNREAVELLAESYFSTGQKEQAIQVLRKGLWMAPTSTRLTYALAHDLYQMERGEEARTYYQKLLELPFDPVVTPAAHFELGMIEWKMGNLGEAEHHLQVVSELSPEVSNYRFALNRLRNERTKSSPK